MLHRIRRDLRALAATMLVLVSALGTWSAFAHELDCHDRDGDPVLVAHDASAHAFRGAALPPAERPVHCVLCHWTRALNAGGHSVAAALVIVGRSFAVPVGDTALAGLNTAAQPPLRAPPSAATLDVVA